MSAPITATEPRHSNSLRATVRRLFAYGSSNEGTSGPVGVFDRAQNTRIQHANFTINQYGGIVPDHARGDRLTTEGQHANEATSAPFSQQEHNLSSSPRRESPNVYVDCLITKNRGYPLWIPSPNTSLPVLNRELGVSLGDLGVLTPEGGFDFLFNIFHDAMHPINASVDVPEGFVPFSLGASSEFIEWNAGSYLSDPSIIRVDDGRDRLKTVLMATAPEAAALMMPEEIHTSRLVRKTVRLRKYIEENIASWYKFVKHTLEYDIENGDLRVVYGCRKSSGFGIATAFNTGRRENTQLTFMVDSTWADISGCPYRWSHTGSAEAKAGPSRQESSDISSTEQVRNQCLFVSTIDTKVSARVWQHIEELETGTAIDETARLTLNTPRPQTGSPRQRIGELAGTEEPLTSRRYDERVFHPAAILHDILETTLPGLPVYMVCNEDWGPFITNKDINVSEFVKQVLEKRIIVEHQGMACFNEDDNIHISTEAPDTSVAKIQFICTSPTEDGVNPLNVSNQWNAIRTPLNLPSYSQNHEEQHDDYQVLYLQSKYKDAQSLADITDMVQPHQPLLQSTYRSEHSLSSDLAQKEDSSKHVRDLATTSGEPSAASAAPDPSPHIHMRCLIPTHLATIIVGEGGSHVKEIREKIGVRVMLSKVIPGNREHILHVSGPLDAVSKAFSLIVRRINDEPSDALSVPGSRAVTVKFIILNSIIGSVIGKNGSKIKEIQDASCARLSASEGMLHGSAERILNVVGVADAIHIATYYIGNILIKAHEEARSYLPSDSCYRLGNRSDDMPSRGQDSGGPGIYVRPGSDNLGSSYTPHNPPARLPIQQSYVPKNPLDSIISKWESKIKDIPRMSSSQIKIMEPGAVGVSTGGASAIPGKERGWSPLLTDQQPFKWQHR